MEGHTVTDLGQIDTNPTVLRLDSEWVRTMYPDERRLHQHSSLLSPPDFYIEGSEPETLSYLWVNTNSRRSS